MLNTLLGLALVAAGLTARADGAGDASHSVLTLEGKIPLGVVRGRIDHLALDLERQRVYVAELGNNSVAVVDLKDAALIHRLKGLKEPQGVAYDHVSDTLFVANAGDGSVRMFSGKDFALLERIDLGADADNVRLDPAARRAYVGYGEGALAVIDVKARQKVAEIALKGHPESFQLAATGGSIFVNVPDANEIAVVDRQSGRQTGSWPTHDLRANFPLAIDPAGSVLTIFRSPPKLVAYGMQDGRAQDSLATCGDADDVFVDEGRTRVYVICGAGFVDVLSRSGGHFSRLGKFATGAGARTGLFVRELDRLLVPVRAGNEVWLWTLIPR